MIFDSDVLDGLWVEVLRQSFDSDRLHAIDEEFQSVHLSEGELVENHGVIAHGGLDLKTKNQNWMGGKYNTIATLRQQRRRLVALVSSSIVLDPHAEYICTNVGSSRNNNNNNNNSNTS